MSEPLKPLYELVREWRESNTSLHDSMLESLADELEAQLRAWDEHLPQDNFDPTRWPDHIRKTILGVPPKSEQKAKKA